jgi:hypothetical protein
MRQLKVFLAVLVFAIAACRSVPSEVRQAHDLSLVESRAALETAQDTLTKIETKSEELNDESVMASYKEWKEHVENLYEARETVRKYLVDSKAGTDVIEPYAVGQQLLIDMNDGFAAILMSWKEMLKSENQTEAAEFVRLFRKDIERYRVLERKFDEYIKQFKVKG